MSKIREILENLLKVVAGASKIAIDRGADSGAIDFREVIDHAEIEIESEFSARKQVWKKGLLEKIEKLKKENIDRKEYMCCDDMANPVKCLYDAPYGSETCEPMNRGISKEKCKNYRLVQVEYEDYTEWNDCLSEIKKLIDEV